MSGTAAFDGAPERGTINFSVGQPSADLLPLKLLAGGGERFFADAAPFDLNYGQRQGDARFRGALADFLGAAGGTPVDPDSLMLTGGISQALDAGQVAGAALDVLTEHSPELRHHRLVGRDNLLLTPHVAFYSEASLEDLWRISANNIRAFLEGRPEDVFRLVPAPGNVS